MENFLNLLKISISGFDKFNSVLMSEKELETD